MSLPTDSGLEVLVVEDEPVVREVVTILLTESGYRVCAADSAESALLIWRDQKIGLLLTDVNIGAGANGVELAEMLKLSRPVLKVIYMSGRTPGEVRAGGLVEGKNFLQKPFKASQLLDAVADCVEQGSR